MTTSAFWDKIAPRYAARPVQDPNAYAETLERTQSYLSADDDVLEVGCGTGTTALHLAYAVRHITATDYAQGMIDIAEGKRADKELRNVTFRQAGLSEPDDQTYDAVLAFNLLHLIEDVPAAIDALAVRLKPGGYFISKTVCLAHGGWPLRLLIPAMRLVGKAPYVGFLRRTEMNGMIEAAGLQIVETGGYPSARNHFIVARKT
ncbi:MAG: class I SAM-dependent methyltransferase [Pseudomonadota bacterium]